MPQLDASSCQLTTVPAEIEKCASLEELLLFANKIKEVPAALASIEGLTTLNLFNNQLKKLPPEIGKLSKLEEVNCAANKMMMLTDAHFTSWGTVKILSLYDNNLVRMGSLASLVALEEVRAHREHNGTRASRAHILSPTPSLPHLSSPTPPFPHLLSPTCSPTPALSCASRAITSRRCRRFRRDTVTTQLGSQPPPTN